jgi:hypothetical protein
MDAMPWHCGHRSNDGMGEKRPAMNCVGLDQRFPK